MSANSTALTIIEVAQELVQTRGYNAFSYRDLAKRVGIKTSSIHYHFPAKEDLGVAMMRHYRERAAGELARIDAQGLPPRERLGLYVRLFEEILENGERLCLWAVLATDYATLPERVQAEVRDFYRFHETWLEALLESGRQAGDFVFPGSARESAEACFSVLEGALVTARVFEDVSRLSAVGEWIEALIAAKS